MGTTWEGEVTLHILVSAKGRRPTIMNFGAYMGTACTAVPPLIQRETGGALEKETLLSIYSVEYEQTLSRVRNPGPSVYYLWSVNRWLFRK